MCAHLGRYLFVLGRIFVVFVYNDASAQYSTVITVVVVVLYRWIKVFYLRFLATREPVTQTFCQLFLSPIILKFK